MGRWSSPQTTPIVGLHLSLLPSGNALLWGHSGEPQVWNAQGGNFTQVANTICDDPLGCELFCSGHTILADGRLLVAGGHWQHAGPMSYARWYPTLVTLEDGKVVALSGNQTPGVNAFIPERWDGNGWTTLTGADLKLPTYPRAFVEPNNGHVFVAGHLQVRFLDPNGNGSWSLGPARRVADRQYGAAVMLDSKVLYAGGGGRACPGAPERHDRSGRAFEATVRYVPADEGALVPPEDVFAPAAPRRPSVSARKQGEETRTTCATPSGSRSSWRARSARRSRSWPEAYLW